MEFCGYKKETSEEKSCKEKSCQETSEEKSCKEKSCQETSEEKSCKEKSCQETSEEKSCKEKSCQEKKIIFCKFKTRFLREPCFKLLNGSIVKLLRIAQ